MNKQELQYIKENYFNDKIDMGFIFEMIEEAQKNLLEEEPERKDITLRLPIIRISEKMWGKEGTKDREVI